MKHKWGIRLAAATLAALLLAGCGGSGGASNAMDSANGPQAEISGSYDSDYSSGLQSGITPDLNTDRKIIYTADLRLETTSFDEARDTLLAAVDAAGAYISSTDLSGSAEDGNRRLYYTVRVPVAKYTSFLNDAGEAGNVLNLTESMDDITNNYIDVQARLSSLENQRARLEELAAQAETTAELLEIEERLADVQYMIESYTRQLMAMDDKIDYSTVDISLKEVSYLTPVTHTFLDRLIEAFFSGWRNFGSGLQDLIIALVYLMPTLLLIAAIWAVVRKFTAKGREARKAEREAARQARLNNQPGQPYAGPTEPEHKSGPKY